MLLLIRTERAPLPPSSVSSQGYPETMAKSDLNRDSQIAVPDFALFIQHFGR